MKYSIIASSSKGNCYLVEAGESKVMIDCGISYKRIVQSLDKLGTSFDDIDAILITHSHIDHINALQTITRKYPDIPIHAGASTINEILKRRPFQKMYIEDFSKQTLESSYIELKDIVAFPKELEHDVQCYGFVIVYEDKTIIHATDTKSFEAFKGIKDVSLLAAESNYDYEELMEDLEKKATDSKPKSHLEYLYRKFDTHASNDDFNAFLKSLKRESSSIQFVQLHTSDAHNKILYNKFHTALQKAPITIEL